MTPFVQYHSRYLGFRTALDISQLLKHVEEDAAGLNNLFMAGLGMGTLFLRMGAVIQMSEKLHDGDTGNDALFMKQVMDNLRETLPSDTNWKNLWYASMTPESKWDNAIPRDSNKVSMLDRFVAFRNKYVHQSIRLIPEHLKDIEKGIQVLDDMASLFVLFEAGEIELKDERHFWRQGESALDLSPFVQKGAQEGLPYLFQGFYENKSKAKFINTVYGDETLPEANLKLNEKFEPIQQALSGGAGQVFDHSERLKYYLDCFVGREREVRSVLEWVNGDSMNNVLPIYSEAGMGKGALTAGVIDGLMRDGIPVMYHYCGSGMANSLHAVLYHFILQGKKLPGMNGAGIWKVKDESVQRRMDRLPSRYLDAIHLFQQLLDDCYNPPKKYEDKPLVIVIDGLDEAAVANSQLNVSDWFYRYNDKDEPEADWKSPGFVKWIFTYRSLPGNRKEGYRLDGRFSLEQNELIQPIRGLTEGAVRAAVKSYNLSEDFITTLIERGREDGNNIDPAYFKLIFNAIRNSGTADYEQVTLPLGLSGIYEERFQIQPISIRNLINSTFVTIAHLREPFSLDLLAQINPKLHKEFLEFILNNFSDLFSFVNSNRFQVNHDRLRNFLLQYNSSNIQYLNIEILILNALNQISQNQKCDLSIYSLKHLSKHLLFVGIRDFEDNRLYKISTDSSFFKKQYEELNTRIYSHAFINDALKLVYYRTSEINPTLKLIPNLITLFELKGELEFNDINSLSSIANLMIVNNFELGLNNFSYWQTYVVKHVKNNGSNSPGEFIFLGYIYLIIKISRNEGISHDYKASLIHQFNQLFLDDTPNSSDYYSIHGDDLLEFFLFENESMILIEYFNVLRSFNIDYYVIVEKISKKENIFRFCEEISKVVTDSYVSRRFKQKVKRTWDVWEFNSVFYKAKTKQLGGNPEGGEVFGNDDLVEIYWDLIEDGVRENEQYLEKIVSEFKVIKHRKALCERNLIINSCSLQFGLESLNSYLTWPRFVSPDGEDYNLFIVDLIDYNLQRGNIKIVEILFRRIARFPEFDLMSGNFIEICKVFTLDEVWNYGFELLNLYEEYSELHYNEKSYFIVYENLVKRLIELEEYLNVFAFCRREILSRKNDYLKRCTENLIIRLLNSKIKLGLFWKFIEFAVERDFENYLFVKFRLYNLIMIKDWKSDWIDEEELSITNIATTFDDLCDLCEYHIDTVVDYCYEDDILEMLFELLKRCIYVSKDFSTLKAISVFYNFGRRSGSDLKQDSDFGWDSDGVKKFLNYLALFCNDCNIDYRIYKSIIISEVRYVYLESKVNEFSLLKLPSKKFVLKGMDVKGYFNHESGRNREMRYGELIAEDIINYIQNSNTLELKSRALQDVSKFICISQITEEFLVKVLPLYSKFDVSADLLLRKYHAKLIIDGKGKFERVKSEYYDLSFLVDSFMIQEISEKEDFDVFIDILNWSVLDKIPDVNFIIDYISDDFFKIVILLVSYKLGKVDGAQVNSFVENLEVARDDEQFVVDGFLFCVNHFNKKDIVIGEIDRILSLADEVLIGFFVDEDTGEVYERTEHRVFVYFYLSFCFFALDHVQKTKETLYSCLEFSLDIDSDSGKEWLDIVISIWKNLFGIDDLKKFVVGASASLKSGTLISRIEELGLK